MHHPEDTFIDCMALGKLVVTSGGGSIKAGSLEGIIARIIEVRLMDICGIQSKNKSFWPSFVQINYLSNPHRELLDINYGSNWQEVESTIEEKRQKEEIPLVLSAPPDRKNRKLLRGTGIELPPTPCTEGKVRFFGITM